MTVPPGSTAGQKPNREEESRHGFTRLLWLLVPGLKTAGLTSLSSLHGFFRVICSADKGFSKNSFLVGRIISH